MDWITEEWVVTALTFIIMGVFTVVVKISNSQTRLNFKQIFATLYINMVAGWGIFSLLTSWNSWFGVPPQKVFVILAVTYGGYDAIDRLRKSGWLGRLIEFILKGK